MIDLPKRQPGCAGLPLTMFGDGASELYGVPRASQRRAMDRWQRAKPDNLLGTMAVNKFILSFALTNTDLDTKIVGTPNPPHLHDDVAILQKSPLPAELYAKAKRHLTWVGSASV